MGANRLVEERIKEFLREDIGQGDITSEALVDEDQESRALLFFKEEGVTAGLEEVRIVFDILGCSVELLVGDGERVPAGKTLMKVEGPAKSLLSGERTALNIVGRMSGIATAVARAQAIISKANPSVRVAATRKTVPGLRALDKVAAEPVGVPPSKLHGRLLNRLPPLSTSSKLGPQSGQALGWA